MFTTKARLSVLGTVLLILALFLAGCSAEGGRAALDLLPGVSHLSANRATSRCVAPSRKRS